MDEVDGNLSESLQRGLKMATKAIHPKKPERKLKDPSAEGVRRALDARQGRLNKALALKERFLALETQQIEIKHAAQKLKAELDKVQEEIALVREDPDFLRAGHIEQVSLEIHELELKLGEFQFQALNPDSDESDFDEYDVACSGCGLQFSNLSMIVCFSCNRPYCTSCKPGVSPTCPQCRDEPTLTYPPH